MVWRWQRVVRAVNRGSVHWNWSGGGRPRLMVWEVVVVVRQMMDRLVDRERLRNWVRDRHFYRNWDLNRITTRR